MAEEKGPRKRMDKDIRDRYAEDVDENGIDEEEPNFSDPEDYVDKVTDEGMVYRIYESVICRLLTSRVPVSSSLFSWMYECAPIAGRTWNSDVITFCFACGNSF
jgi:hypothetical protein